MHAVGLRAEGRAHGIRVPRRERSPHGRWSVGVGGSRPGLVAGVALVFLLGLLGFSGAGEGVFDLGDPAKGADAGAGD